MKGISVNAQLKPVLSCDGVDYYDLKLKENVQLSCGTFAAAAKLWENWFYDWGVGSQPGRPRSTQDAIERFIDYIGHPYYELTEAWLLYGSEDEQVYNYDLFEDACRSSVRLPLVHQSCALNLRHSIARRPCYHALLLLAAVWNEPPKSRKSLYISVEALCRNPWADTAVCASWADMRALSLSRALGGCIEVRFTATEFDLELQLALRGLGYLCEGYLSGRSFGASDESEDRKLGLHNPAPYLDFSKILRLRSRQALNLPDPFVPWSSSESRQSRR